MTGVDQLTEPLQRNVIAVLNKNVTTLQPNAIVRAYPWSAYGNDDYCVIVDISRFDRQLGKSVVIEAGWTIMKEKP